MTFEMEVPGYRTQVLVNAVTGELESASLFCSAECPEVEHLRFSVIYGRSGFVDCVTVGKIRNNL